MIVIEITAAINADGVTKTFYVSDTAYATKPTDSPANTAFEPTVKDPGTIGISVFGDGQIAGATQLETGEIVLSNANGQYDGWKDYGFGGRPVVIRHGEPGNAYPGSFVTVFSGVVANVYVDRKELRIRLKDKQHIFERQLLTDVYKGTNALPNGIEGTASDIKGRVKPSLFGNVGNIQPPCVNTSKLTFQVNNGAVSDITAVYDRGVALTKGANYTSLTAFEAATPAAGSYVTCLPMGLFRLGSAPAGAVTADVTGAGGNSAAQVLKSMALRAGVSASEIDNDAIAAMDALNSSTVGIYVDDERSALEAMDAIARSVGAYYGFTPQGQFTVGIWTAPAGASLALIGEFYAGKQTERRPLKDIDTPVFRVRVKHSKNFTQQTTDLAGSVTQARRAYLAEEYRSEVAEDTGLLVQHPTAETFEVETLLTLQAAAANEAARLLAIHKVKRDAFEVPIPFSLLGSAGLRLAACVTLQISRFGLEGGKLMRIQRVRLELARNRAVLTVWG